MDRKEKQSCWWLIKYFYLFYEQNKNNFFRETNVRHFKKTEKNYLLCKIYLYTNMNLSTEHNFPKRNKNQMMYFELFFIKSKVIIFISFFNLVKYKARIKIKISNNQFSDNISWNILTKSVCEMILMFSGH